MPVQRSRDLVDQAIAPEVLVREVDRNRERAVVLGAPGGDLPAHLVQHPLAQRDAAGVVPHRRQELVRQEEPARRVLPADQRLEPGDGDPARLTIG